MLIFQRNPSCRPSLWAIYSPKASPDFTARCFLNEAGVDVIGQEFDSAPQHAARSLHFSPYMQFFTNGQSLAVVLS